ncbi:formylglycine-generating enzyme family protein [Candidatus Entotheonella palauensis]|uniref:formylglycine-generating enzyme family protein n=1 Tax=Candidatus Entotheonella palauensis TaxID=93172 RepID=UPI000B7D05DC|nr:formylglycine-generating enzyme family protein [Candidatus Entotheonella palauensis]
MMFYDPLSDWLNRHALAWSIALGTVVGLGVGMAVLFGLGGMLGVGLGMLMLGLVVWAAKDAEPVLVTDAPAQPFPVIDELLEMVELDGGTFRMGSPDSDRDALKREKPQHDVTVSAFAMSRYPVTRQLYRRLLAPPVRWEREDLDDRLPANDLNWFEAVAFCNALSRHMGLQPCYRIIGTHVEWDMEADGYRLPTEAEWEYACRGRTATKWFFGDNAAELDAYAWYARNSGFRVHPVGEKASNPWGLHDMIGNVLEWCWDWSRDYSSEDRFDPTGPADGVFRVLRGGWSFDNPAGLRSAVRFRGMPEGRRGDVGFRCVRRSRRQL